MERAVVRQTAIFIKVLRCSLSAFVNGRGRYFLITDDFELQLKMQVGANPGTLHCNLGPLLNALTQPLPLIE